MQDAGTLVEARRPVWTAKLARAARDRRYTARLALDAETRRDAYALRYASYRAGGHIAANRRGLFSDRFDALPDSLTIVLYEAADAVASARVCFAGTSPGLACPAASAFPAEIGALLAAASPSRTGCEGIEVNRLVRSPTIPATHGLVFLLYRLAGHLALARDFRTVFLCARPNHAPFYARLGFGDIAGPRAYPGLSCAMRLLASSRAEYETACRSFPMMDPSTDGGTVDAFLGGETVGIALASPS